MKTFTLLLTLLAGTCTMAQDKRELHQAPATFFVGGPRVDDAEALQRWLSGHQHAASVKLPFTVWRAQGGRLAGAIGVHAQLPEPHYRFDDSALGIALPQRLERLCKEERCEVWLSGRLGSLLGNATEPTFSVFAVHELVTGGGPHFAQAGRRVDCLALQVMKKLHCARGPSRCEKCKAAAAEPARPKLLDLCPWPPDAARPVVELARDGGTQHRVYEVLKTFDTVEQARAFAAEYGLRDVKL